MSSNGKAPVPKFGSFRPKTAKELPTNALEPTAAKARASRDDRARWEEQHREHGARHERRHDQNFKGRDLRELGPSPKLTNDEFEESDIYMIDKRGDAKNVEYGSLHRYSIPAYHRAGFGHVMGLSTNFKIDREDSTDREIVFRTAPGLQKTPIDGLRVSKRGNPHGKNLRLIKSIEGEEPFAHEQNYIQVRPRLKRKRGSDATAEASTIGDYRSVEGHLNSTDQPEDDDSEFFTDSDEDFQDKAELESRQENATLFKNAKENPTDLDGWLAVVHHQSKMIRRDADVSAFTSSERKSLADIRLSIYERAMKHIDKTESGHDRLLLGHIQEGAHVWEASKLIMKWNESLRQSPDSIMLWKEYLNFVQSSPQFQYEKCKAVYVKYLKILQSAFTNASTSKEKREIGRTRVYTFLRLTAFIRDSGYDELAYALWQVILEYHFFKPNNLITRETQITSLEEFWENDVPRIGEEGAQGWHRSVGGTEISSRSPMIWKNVSKIRQDDSTNFAEREAHYMRGLLLPAGLADETDSDDPFRHVIFSDLEEIVESLYDELSHFELINGFLCFMGLPSLPSPGTTEELGWWTDVYLQTTFTDHAATAAPKASLVSLLHDSTPIKNYRKSAFSLFHDSFRSARSRFGDSNDRSKLANFTDLVLSALVSAQPENDTLAEYYIAYQLQILPHKASKTAKRFLQARTDSLRLYNAYALVEFQLGRQDRAAEVWKAALSGIGNKNDEAVLLWHSWSCSLINSGKDTEALRCLLSMCEGVADMNAEAQSKKNVATTQQLKASRHLSESFERMVWNGKIPLAALYLEAWTWATYLCESYSLEMACQIFDKGFIRLQKEGVSGGSALEILHQRRADMMRHHIDRRRPFQPATVRSRARESINLFPDNSVFYALYFYTGPQSRIDDRLIDTISTRHLIAASHVLAEKLKRYGTGSEITGSTADSVRALSIKILLDSEGEAKYSSSLWTSWLLFEAYMTERQQSDQDQKAALEQVKMVYHNGLRHLPWCKQWVVLGLRMMHGVNPSATEVEEKKALVILSERALRVRTIAL